MVWIRGWSESELPSEENEPAGAHPWGGKSSEGALGIIRVWVMMVQPRSLGSHTGEEGIADGYSGSLIKRIQWLIRCLHVGRRNLEGEQIFCGKEKWRAETERGRVSQATWAERHPLRISQVKLLAFYFFFISSMVIDLLIFYLFRVNFVKFILLGNYPFIFSPIIG